MAKNSIKVNIHAFSEKFEKEYDFLYKNEDRVAGYQEAVDSFDEYYDEDYCGFRDFVDEFVSFRGDYIISDRECAAFMFALECLDALV